MACSWDVSLYGMGRCHLQWPAARPQVVHIRCVCHRQTHLMQMLKRRGARKNSCGTPFVKLGNLLRLPLLVVRIKLRLPTMSKWTMRLSASNRSNLQLQAALTAVTEFMRVYLAHHLLFLLHSRQCEIFAVIVCNLCWGGIDSVWVCNGGM